MSDPKPMDPERLEPRCAACNDARGFHTPHGDGWEPCWRCCGPMPAKRLAEIRSRFTGGSRSEMWFTDTEQLAEDLIALLADRDYQERRAEQAEREREEARDDRDMFRARANRYAAVLAELPCDCWPEYEGASAAVARLVEQAEIGRQWQGDSSLEMWFPLTAERMKEAEADVTRLRARVRVEAEDVERAGVTKAHVEAWLRANGWGAPTRDKYGWTSAESETGGEPVDLWRTDGSTPLALTVCFIADDIQRPGLDILDEMAAMPLEPAPR
jgi:hypothetical protein